MMHCNMLRHGAAHIRADAVPHASAPRSACARACELSPSICRVRSRTHNVSATRRTCSLVAQVICQVPTLQHALVAYLTAGSHNTAAARPSSPCSATCRSSRSACSSGGSWQHSTAGSDRAVKHRQPAGWRGRVPLCCGVLSTSLLHYPNAAGALCALASSSSVLQS